jgi:hypothetical protein
VLAALARAATSPFKGENGAPNYFKDVMLAMLRVKFGNQSIAQDRYLNSNTTAIYQSFANANKFAPESITLPSGTQAHWIGNKNAKKVFLYYHGMYANHFLIGKSNLPKAEVMSYHQPKVMSKHSSI